jgi:plasmid replication initiation protein
MKKNKSETAITQSNILIESRYRLTLSETRLFLWMLKEVQPGDEDFRTYRIFIKDFIDNTDNKSQSIYTQAKTTTKKFLSKVLELEDGNLQIQFMSMIRYYPGKGYLDFRFDKALKPHLLRLRKQFTTYDIMNVINYKYSHSVRIYQILKSFKGRKKSMITVKDLRCMLMLESEYVQWHDFKRFVLDRSKSELKKHSDIYFSYKTQKRGRSVYSITFTIHKQQQRNLFNSKPEPTLADAIPAVDYHKSAEPIIKKIEDAGKDAVPMPDYLKR